MNSGILKRAKQLTKKLEPLMNNPKHLIALADGVYHYTIKNDITEALKDERAKECSICDMIEDDFEPIEDDDERISNKMCGECFCSLPFLLRQTKKSCELKKWK